MDTKNTLLRFGRGVERLRCSAGLTRQALSERCVRFKGCIPKIENGSTKVTLDMVLVLADALAVEPCILLREMDVGEATVPTAKLRH